MIKWKIEQAITFCDDVKDGTHDSPKQVSNGYKLLTSKHITNGVIDTKSAKQSVQSTMKPSIKEVKST